MIKRVIQRFLANPKKRLFVVTGEQFREFKEPPYSTDPRDYGFDQFKGQTESPKSFPPLPWDRPPGSRSERPPAITKAFRIAGDAIDFAYCCNLDSVITYVFDRLDEKWVASEDQTAFDIDW